MNLMLFVIQCAFFIKYIEAVTSCRDRSNQLRQDGGLCFEIPPWQHKPVEVEKHLNRVRSTWGSGGTERRQTRKPKLALTNSEINRYMDTVIAPFLDTYHRNIQSSYQQLTNKILKKIKEEINAAIIRKQKINTELAQLANSLNVPEMCDEERRSVKTLASKHVSMVYDCTEQARYSISKMGKYAEEMISLTQNHMERALADTVKNVDDEEKIIPKTNVTDCLKDLSKSAVTLGYELDLSLTNARRHNDQSCEKLVNCCLKAVKSTDEEVQTLSDYLYQCVYA